MPIQLTLPIRIRETIEKDGYVITDANDTEHFFYRSKADKELMVYDGSCRTVKKNDDNGRA